MAKNNTEKSRSNEVVPLSTYDPKSNENVEFYDYQVPNKKIIKLSKMDSKY